MSYAKPDVHKRLADLVGYSAAATPPSATFAANAVFLASDFTVPIGVRRMIVTLVSDTASVLQRKIGTAWAALNGGAAIPAASEVSFSFAVEAEEALNFRLVSGGVVSRFLLEGVAA